MVFYIWTNEKKTWMKCSYTYLVHRSEIKGICRPYADCQRMVVIYARSAFRDAKRKNRIECNYHKYQCAIGIWQQRTLYLSAYLLTKSTHRHIAHEELYNNLPPSQGMVNTVPCVNHDVPITHFSALTPTLIIYLHNLIVRLCIIHIFNAHMAHIGIHNLLT